jgi:hypothetical protein
MTFSEVLFPGDKPTRTSLATAARSMSQNLVAAVTASKSAIAVTPRSHLANSLLFSHGRLARGGFPTVCTLSNDRNVHSGS